MLRFLRSRPVFWFVIMVSVMSWEQVQACASCGSGGDDPLVLYPNERWKIYLGLSKTGDVKSYDYQDEEIQSFALTSRSSTTVAIGKSFSPKLFATVTAPYMVNRKESYEMSGWGDPLVTLRYTVLAQNLATEYLPQVQVMGGYRPSAAPSIYDAKDSAFLDVRGSGVPESRVGIDVWHGMTSWKGGLAQTVTIPLADRETDFGRKKPGVTYRTTATTGYGWGSQAKILTGLNRDHTTRFAVDGREQPRSEITMHGVFVSGDLMVSRDSNVRLTYAKNGISGSRYLKNVNAVRSQSVNIAVTRQF